MPEARFGLLASARDKELPNWGIANDWNSTKTLRVGPWYGDGEESPRSCRRLVDCVTEFSAQGLELDGVLLAWGTDLVRVSDHPRATNRGAAPAQRAGGATARTPGSVKTSADSAAVAAVSLGGTRWSDAWARRYARGAHVKDPFQLRLNAYRVLLTRGRDVTVIFVPPIPALDQTYAWLQAHGIKEL